MARPSGFDSFEKVKVLLEVLDRAYNRQSWHGTNLRGSIRGVTASVAAKRPAPGRHNIWELVVHAAYWKYTVLRRITAEPRGSFELKGSNWFTRPDNDADERLWNDDRALLERTHANLRTAVEGLANRDLCSVSSKSKVNLFELIAGIAAHDLYHAGQIQLIKRLTTSKQ